MKLEVMKEEGDPRLGHRRFLAREVIVKLPGDCIEQRREFGIGRRRGGVEQTIERGVVAIHERNAEAGSRQHRRFLLASYFPAQN